MVEIRTPPQPKTLLRWMWFARFPLYLLTKGLPFQCHYHRFHSFCISRQQPYIIYYITSSPENQSLAHFLSLCLQLSQSSAPFSYHKHVGDAFRPYHLSVSFKLSSRLNVSDDWFDFKYAHSVLFLKWCLSCLHTLTLHQGHPPP